MQFYQSAEIAENMHSFRCKQDATQISVSEDIPPQNKKDAKCLPFPLSFIVAHYFFLGSLHRDAGGATAIASLLLSLTRHKKKQQLEFW